MKGSRTNTPICHHFSLFLEKSDNSMKKQQQQQKLTIFAKLRKLWPKFSVEKIIFIVFCHLVLADSIALLFSNSLLVCSGSAWKKSFRFWIWSFTYERYKININKKKSIAIIRRYIDIIKLKVKLMLYWIFYRFLNLSSSLRPIQTLNNKQCFK